MSGQWASLFGSAALSLSLLSGTAIAGSVRPPLGMQLFCLQNPAECKAGQVERVEATNELLASLRVVNSRVNAQIAPRADIGGDVWSSGTSSGDCEDYALTKRAALIKIGVPSGALRIAYTRAPGGEGHALLVVRTSDGDLVLDNLTGRVLPLGQSGYRLISISSSDPKRWSGA